MAAVLDTLLKALHDLEARTGRNRQLVEANIASLFLRWVFGDEWHSKHIALNSHPDPWMLNGDDAWLARNPIPHDARRLVYNHRLVRFADALFTLMTERVVGGEGLRQRFLTRPDTRASFTETEIASMLVYNDCPVHIVEESGVRGRDFDLIATVKGIDVSVEVTAMSDGPLSVRTVLNKLHGKRDQVPADRPAVLYLHVPATWMRDDATAAPVFIEASARFMERSQRFNAIVLVWEEVLPFAGGGIPRMMMRPGYNNRPRHFIPEMAVLTPKPDKIEAVRCAASLLDRLEAYRDKQGGGTTPD